jgi:hypothetical protein
MRDDNTTDRTAIRTSLEAAERRVAEGADLVAQQVEYVAERIANGLDSGEAERLLAEVKDLQARLVADRDRLHRELGH